MSPDLNRSAFLCFITYTTNSSFVCMSDCLFIKSFKINATQNSEDYCSILRLSIHMYSVLYNLFVIFYIFVFYLYYAILKWSIFEKFKNGCKLLLWKWKARIVTQWKMHVTATKNKDPNLHIPKQCINRYMQMIVK